MDDVLRALAHPHRRRILTLVADRELAAGDIAARFELTRPAVSQHLGVLKDARLLAVRRQGTKRLYTARPESLADVRTFLERFWGDGLERLKLAAELEDGRRSGGRRAP